MSNKEKRKSPSDIGSRSRDRSLAGSRKSGKVDSPVHSTTMDRSSMLLMEANEISQYLHLDYVFARVNSCASNDEVKVLDTKQNISCIWSIVKLKEKLIRIRKLMYAEDSENSSKSIAMTVLFDQSDSLIHESTESGLQQLTSDIDSSSNKSSTTSVQNSRDSFVHPWSSSFSDATDAAVIEIRNNNHPAGSPPPTSHSSSPSPSHPYPVHRNRERHHIHDRHLPIRSLSCHELTSTYKPGGLPEKYLTVSSDEELKKTSLRSAKSFDVNRASPGKKAAPRLKNPMHVDRNISLRFSSLRAYTSQKQSVLLPPCDAEVQTDGASMTIREMSTYGLCRDLTTMALTRFSYCSMEVSTVDRILCACESIRQGVQHLWAIRTNSKTTNINDIFLLSQNMMESNEVEKLSVQVTISLEVLISQVLTWCALVNAPDDSMVAEQKHSLLHTVKELTKDVVTLWQSCEKEVNDLVKDSVSKILNLLQQLCVACGKLAATLDICPKVLSDQKKASLEQVISQKTARLDDLLNAQPSPEVKCSFLAGCDIVVDRSLLHCLQSTDNIHSNIKAFSEFSRKDSSQRKGELFQLVCNVITASRTIFVQLQQVQIEMYSKAVEDAQKPTDYYHYYFERCISMVRESQKFVDSLELLKLALQPMNSGKIDGGILRKICRCAEMAQRSADRLLQSSYSLKNSQIIGSSNGNFPAAQLLFPIHETRLDNAQAVLVHSTRALCSVIKDMLVKDFADKSPPSADKVRRLLPVTPSRRPIHLMRCQSASICDQRPILSKQFSLNNFSSRSTELRNEHWNKL